MAWLQHCGFLARTAPQGTLGRWADRIRLKSTLILSTPDGQRLCKISDVKLQPREPICFHHVCLTGRQFAPVHVVQGRPSDDPEQWQVVSNDPTRVETFGEYGERFQMEEGFLDEKSGLFELEASKLRDANSLERLVMVISVATLLLVAEALDVVERGD